MEKADWRSLIQNSARALLFVALATLGRSVVQYLLHDESYTYFYPIAVVAATLLYGFWPGLFTAVSSVIVANIFFDKFQKGIGEIFVVDGVRVLGLVAVSTIVHSIQKSKDDSMSLLNEAKDLRRQSDQAIRDIYENAPCGYHSIDRDGTIIQMNKTELGWLGYDAVEVIDAMKIVDILAPGERSKFVPGLFELMTIGYVKDHETVLKRKNGSTFPVLVNSVANRDVDGNFVSSRASVLDISDRVSIEKERAAKEILEASSRAKSEFLANMSHEIRTPLSSILGFTDLLIENKLPLEVKTEYCSIIRRNGRMLSELIDNLLDLSKIEAGKLEVDSKRVSVSDVVFDALSSFVDQCREKGLKLSLILESKVPEFIFSDQVRLRQILVNLLSNAVKFTDEGEISLSLSYAPSRQSSDGGQISFTVMDTGIGVPSAFRKRLFMPFSQAMTSDTQRSGTGLGLELSRRFAHALGGDVTFAENPTGIGSSFTAVVNTGTVSGASFLAALKIDYATSESQKPERHASIRGCKILVVDDSEDHQALFNRVLSSRGVRVESASNATDGLRMAQETKYDVILMDIQLPGMNGLDATRNLRRSGFSGPIIALSARAFKEDLENSFTAGCDAHLTKPISVEELLRTLVRFTSHKYSSGVRVLNL